MKYNYIKIVMVYTLEDLHPRTFKTAQNTTTFILFIT
jgi:hypothetical protein